MLHCYEMDLRHLRYVIAVADAGGVGAAARRLRVAQPALSRQIADLEREVGYPLFERLPRGVRPTAAGEALIARARTVVESASEAIEDARRAALGETGHLRIGFNPTVSWRGVIPDSFRAFRAAKPDVRLTMLPMMSVEQISAVLDGRLDAGFLYQRPRDDTRLVGTAVLAEPLMLAVAPDHPLAGHPEPVPVDMLRGRSLVWFVRRVNPAFHDQILAMLARRHALPGTVQETTDTSAMLALVNAGAGYSFVPASARWRKPADVVLKSIDERSVDQTLELVRRAGDHSPALDAFVRLAGSAAAVRSPEPPVER